MDCLRCSLRLPAWKQVDFHLVAFFRHLPAREPDSKRAWQATLFGLFFLAFRGGEWVRLSFCLLTRLDQLDLGSENLGLRRNVLLPNFWPHLGLALPKIVARSQP